VGEARQQVLALIAGCAYTASGLKKAGGKPVRVMLECDAECDSCRLSPVQRLRSESRRKKGWNAHRVAIRLLGHGGPWRRRAPPMPYVVNFQQRKQHTAIAPHGRRERGARPIIRRGASYHVRHSKIAPLKSGMDPLQLWLRILL